MSSCRGGWSTKWPARSLTPLDKPSATPSMTPSAPATRASYGRGHLGTAENEFCALLHECNAQEGKNLSPASAERIRSCALAVAQALGIPEPCTTGSTLL